MFKPIAAAANDSNVSVPTDCHEPTVTSKTTAPLATSAPLAGLPKRSVECLEHINAYLEALASKKPPANQREWSGRTGQDVTHFVHTDGSLTLQGEQLMARLQGKSFTPVTADILGKWIEPGQNQSKKDFAKHHNLCALSFATFAKDDHALTQRGQDVVRRAQGHRFTRCTKAHIKAFEELCAETDHAVSISDYCQEMNFGVEAFYIARKRYARALSNAEQFSAFSQSERNQADTSTNERPDSIDGEAATTQGRQQQVSEPSERPEVELGYRGTDVNQDGDSTDYEWMTDELLEKVRHELIDPKSPKLEVEYRGPNDSHDEGLISGELDLDDWNTDELIDLLLGPEDLMALDEPDLPAQRLQDRI